MDLLDSWLLRIVLFVVVGVLIWSAFKSRPVGFRDFFVGYASRRIRLWIAGIIIVSLILGIIYLYNSSRREHFGATSNGTMIQLQTSHVPTAEEVEEGGRRYRKQVEHDLADMTY
jgi:hypothetical protein